MKVLETERLILRRMSPDDAPFILELQSDPDWLHYIGDRGVRDLDSARNYIVKGPVAMYERLGFGLLAAELKETGAPIGMCGLLKRDTLQDVDIAMWHWMYDHPNATPAELKNAVVQISKDTWNRYYAPVFGKRDVTLLGVYAHMVNNFMYLPDYPIGHLIAHQIEAQIEKSGAIGPEFERMSKFGSVTPDLWMINATGAPVGAQALLDSAEKALAQMAPMVGPAPNKNP